MGMKFHKLYVTVLSPLAILLVALVAVVLLLGALSIDTIADDTVEVITEDVQQVNEDIAEVVNIPLVGDVEAGDILWVLFGLAATLLFFMLLTEILLVARKKFGIILLSLSLLIGIASNIISYINYPAQMPWYTLAVSVVISSLVLIYYWKRYPAFG